MAGLTVNEVTRIEVSDSEGNAMHQGDTIVLRIDTEDILCVFEGKASRVDTSSPRHATTESRTGTV